MNSTERNKLDELAIKVGKIETVQEHQGESINTLQEGQHEQHEKLDRILHHIVGDPETKTKGAVEKLERHEIRLTRLERIYLAAAFLLSVIAFFKNEIFKAFKL